MGGMPRPEMEEGDMNESRMREARGGRAARIKQGPIVRAVLTGDIRTMSVSVLLPRQGGLAGLEGSEYQQQRKTHVPTTVKMQQNHCCEANVLGGI